MQKSVMRTWIDWLSNQAYELTYISGTKNKTFFFCGCKKEWIVIVDQYKILNTNLSNHEQINL